MKTIDGKRILLTCLAIVAASVTTIILKGDVDKYYLLIGGLAGAGITGQTITDSIGK